MLNQKSLGFSAFLSYLGRLFINFFILFLIFCSIVQTSSHLGDRHILDTDPKLACVNNRRVIVGQESKTYLCPFQTQVPPPTPPTNRVTPGPTINPTKICKNNTCRYCPKLDLSGRALSTTKWYHTLYCPLDMYL